MSRKFSTVSDADCNGVSGRRATLSQSSFDALIPTIRKEGSQRTVREVYNNIRELTGQYQLRQITIK